VRAWKPFQSYVDSKLWESKAGHKDARRIHFYGYIFITFLTDKEFRPLPYNNPHTSVQTHTHTPTRTHTSHIYISHIHHTYIYHIHIHAMLSPPKHTHTHKPVGMRYDPSASHRVNPLGVVCAHTHTHTHTHTTYTSTTHSYTFNVHAELSC